MCVSLMWSEMCGQLWYCSVLCAVCCRDQTVLIYPPCLAVGLQQIVRPMIHSIEGFKCQDVHAFIRLQATILVT